VARIVDHRQIIAGKVGSEVGRLWRALVVETWRDIDGYRADEYNRFCPWLA
jgi:hypothetical protein